VRLDPKVKLYEAQVDTATTLMKEKFIPKVLIFLKDFVHDSFV
jgi:hypothetical protein